VAEGEDLLAAADAAGWAAVERYCAAGSGLEGTEVEQAVLASASGLGSGARTLAVYEERWADEPTGPLCVYLHGLSDPGNVGAILRSAQAFGASGVAIGEGTADPFSPKAVRASMGAIFAVSLARVSDVRDLPGRTVALTADHGRPLRDLKLRDVTLVVGSERDGLSEEVLAAADECARVPIAIHSLNAAMAVAIALYEATRDTRMARQ
jgi:TrmH family RNA methyltransferase